MSSIVQKNHPLSTSLDLVHFVHISSEWNDVVVCLSKCAFEHRGNWEVDDWEYLPKHFVQKLKMLIQEDIEDH